MKSPFSTSFFLSNIPTVPVQRQGEVPPRRNSLYRAGGAAGTHQEAYNVERTAIMKEVHHLISRREQGRSFTIFTDSRAAMRRFQHDAPGRSQRHDRASPCTTGAGQHHRHQMGRSQATGGLRATSWPTSTRGRRLSSEP